MRAILAVVCNSFSTDAFDYQGFSVDKAEKGCLPLINLSFSSADNWDLDAANASSSEQSFAQKHASLISVALEIICSGEEDPLLTSAVADLLLLPIIIQCLSFPPSPASTAACSTLPPLQHVTIAHVMAHPITRYVTSMACDDATRTCFAG